MTPSLNSASTCDASSLPGDGHHTAPRVLYIDLDEDLPGLLDRVEEAGTPAIVVLPEGARAVHGMVAARLLQRRADAAGIRLVAVTTDRVTIAQLKGVGIPTASTVGDARRALPNDVAGAPVVTAAPTNRSPGPAPRPAPALPPPRAPDDTPEEGDPFADVDDDATMRVSTVAVDEDDTDDQQAEVPAVQVRVAHTRGGRQGRGRHRARLWAVALLLLTLVVGIGSWIVLFPQATIVISYAATDFDRTYRAVAGSGSDGIPLYTTHLQIAGTRTVPATGTALVPDGHATGTVTLANPLDGTVVVPAGTLVTTDSGLAYATLADLRVPGAVHTFAGTTNGQQSVQVEATQAGTASNIGAGMIAHIRGRLAGVLLITNYNPIGGGTMRTIYSITQDDTASAAATLKERLTAQAENMLRQRLAHSPGRFIVSAKVSAPRVQPTTRDGRLYARVSRTVRVEMVYLHAEDVQRFAATKRDADLASLNLAAVAGTERQDVHVTRTRDRVVVAVRDHERVVPTIDTTNLRGLLTGRSVADARQLLDGSARYGKWTYSLHTSPDWAQRLPQAPGLIHITIRQTG